MRTLSFGQAVLLLFDIHKDDKVLSAKLKKLYLQGVQSAADTMEIHTLFSQCGLSEQYEISCEPRIINEDVSRRYFETHLAFETLKHSLDDLPLSELQSYFASLYHSLIPEKRDKFDAYLAGSISPSEDKFAAEYVDAIAKINTNETYGLLSREQKDKAILLMKCCWLGILHGSLRQLPLNIYGTGFFAEINRGRVPKDDSGKLSSSFCAGKMPFSSRHFGLMKQYMPVPGNDIIYTQNGFTFIKPSDQNNFNPEAEWPKLNFAALVHPFSCSISGTLLCQFQFMKHLHDKSELQFSSPDKFIVLLKCLTSALLFNSGGHVYNEFFAVLQLPEVKKAFEFMDGFAQINMLSVLYNGNEKAFDAALTDTIEYTKVILAKQAFHHKLTNF
ncbi:hypothetical protein AQUSIP_10880 [Aquicella siphonis]|uniref:Uncharacterized protein n=1 Tax=Aquicella siphonis TaxID=254247 RepID=A0A5E4PHJ8_9COXI|nr:hypothetical protein [Aquicella siphonis]VVC75791.1 hypothetical protein AQUSIP_10880 [Aquicella siphonis]